MRDDDCVFYFKFTSITGLEQVLEQGPWMIQNQPLILTKWAPNLALSKDEVSKVPVWVKIHKVPVVEYSEDGLSLIASQIGKPIMLDAFTCATCTKPWGRIRFARALIEVSTDKELKKEVIMVVLILDGSAKPNTYFDDDINMVKLKNHFTALQDQDDVFIANDVGESSKWGANGPGNFEQALQDSESEIKEMYNKYDSKDDTLKGASTPSEDVPHV
ncbi:hypothetical protein Tco_0322862 [Tanacetum coccineum]